VTASASPTEVTLTVESIGARGDGIASHEGRSVYLPLTAPGDRVRARLAGSRGDGWTGEVIALLAPGARTAPICPQFGSCGGCALQHLDADSYARAKERQVAAALRQHGIVLDNVAPLRRLAPGTRRRARFAVQQLRDATSLIGFHARASHRIVDMRGCAVLHPALVALVASLRAAAAALWPGGTAGAATATLCDSGVDLLLDLAASPDLTGLERLAAFAKAADLARLSWRAPGVEAMPAAIRRPVRVVLGGVAVDLPTDAFLQASAEAEAALTAEVLGGIGAAERVADLYAGLGTFTFALARRARVHAVEGTRPALAALAAAAARADCPGRITSERRDLESRPLDAGELRHLDAVVLDPPRSGAHAQSGMLARSAVPRVVYVSCNPPSFARDARLLVDGGYRLLRIQPIDQFIWSPHVELVAYFARPEASPQR
jgi:23S rRNA (uracil1939-C5)-methyltransferase